MKTSSLLSRLCLNSRSIANGLAIGLGVGAATKNLAIGLAIGLVFALVFTARRNYPCGSEAPKSRN